MIVILTIAKCNRIPRSIFANLNMNTICTFFIAIMIDTNDECLYILINRKMTNRTT